MLKHEPENQNEIREVKIVKELFRSKEQPPFRDLLSQIKVIYKKLIKKLETSSFSLPNVHQAWEYHTIISKSTKNLDSEKEMFLKILISELEFFMSVSRKKEITYHDFVFEKESLKFKKKNFKKIGLEEFFNFAKDVNLELLIDFVFKNVFKTIQYFGANFSQSTFLSKESLNNLLIFSVCHEYSKQPKNGTNLFTTAKVLVSAREFKLSDQKIFDYFKTIVQFLEGLVEKYFNPTYFVVFNKFFESEIQPHLSLSKNCKFLMFFDGLYNQIHQDKNPDGKDIPFDPNVFSNLSPREFIDKIEKKVNLLEVIK